MKKSILLIALFAATSLFAGNKGDKRPVITFEKKTVNIGTFPAEDAIRKCYFVFTNTGNSDLYIHQAFASCGCTVPQIPEGAIKPGASDTIFVTYDGRRKAPGKCAGVHRHRSVHQRKCRYRRGSDDESKHR